MKRRFARILTALAPVALIAAAWFASRATESSASFGPQPNGSGAPTAPKHNVDLAGGAPVLPAVEAERAPLVDESAAAPRSTARMVGADAAGAASSTAARPVGYLEVSAIDDVSGDPVPRFALRLVSETRFAERGSSSEGGALTLLLTPDTYSIVVSAPGYEAVELAPARIVAATTTQLEPVRLHGGDGRLSVQVHGALPTGRRIWIQLFGEGRRPCALCDEDHARESSFDSHSAAFRAATRTEPCAHCGFAGELSSAIARADSSFEFSNLASGNYLLRAVDERGYAATQDREFALRAGERAQVELDFSSERYVELEWFDADGSSLSALWSARAVASNDDAQIVSFETVVYTNALALTFAERFADPTTGAIARATLSPPLPNPSAGVSVGVGHYSGRRDAAHSRVDRARQPDDQLWSRPKPRVDAPRVSCDLDDRGIARVGPLPSSALQLSVVARGFAAEASVPATLETARIAVHLRATADDSRTNLDHATYAAAERSGGL